LDSVASSILPEEVQWEVLVVDNNSKDQTRALVEEFGRRHPGRFRYLFEAKQGKSFALNSGIREASGDVLAFMDDDVTVDPMWLQNLTTVLLTGDWGGTGGRTLPARPFTLPPWLTLEGPYEMGGAVAALLDLGEIPGKLNQAPYGTNMAFPKKMFERYGLFAINLGPSPGSQIRGEDTEFGRRLMFAGERLRYEPSALVFHPVLESRAQKDYLLAWWFDHGRALMREKEWRPHVSGIPRHYLSILKAILSRLSPGVLKWMWTLNPSARFFRKCQTSRMIGEIVETYHLARDPKRAYLTRPVLKPGTGVWSKADAVEPVSD